MSYSVKVGRSDTLLTGADTNARRLLFTGENLFHRCHTRVYQEQGFIVIWNTREAVESQMTLALKEGEKALSQIVK